MLSAFCLLENEMGVWLLRLHVDDPVHRLTRDCVLVLTEIVRDLSRDPKPLVITGTGDFFSAGADLLEIAALNAPTAYEFAKMGQESMRQLEDFPAPVFAAVSGYCMGGGLDLALACHQRIAAPNSVFGHRGTALGLITGWGGTQRLPRLIGKARAMEMFLMASRIDAPRALEIGLVDAVVEDPVAEAMQRARSFLNRSLVNPAAGL